MDISEKNQRYTYEDYQKTLRELALIVKKYRNSCIKSAKQMRFWENLINIPVKILLGTSIGGGAVDLFNTNFTQDLQWINYTRIGFEVVILILVTFRDIGNFEKKRSKYTESQTILTSFHNLIRQQMLIKRGYEGDREEIIKEFSETLDNIKSSNIIIQEFAVEEDISRENTLIINKVESRDDTPLRNIEHTDLKAVKFADAIHSDDEPDLESGLQKAPQAVPLSYSQSRRGTVSTSLITDLLTRM